MNIKYWNPMSFTPTLSICFIPWNLHCVQKVAWTWLNSSRELPECITCMYDSIGVWWQGRVERSTITSMTTMIMTTIAMWILESLPYCFEFGNKRRVELDPFRPGWAWFRWSIFSAVIGLTANTSKPCFHCTYKMRLEILSGYCNLGPVSI